MFVIFFKSLVAFAAGAILMLLLSCSVYRRSYYYKKAMAEADGVAREPRGWSRIVTLGILLIMILFIALFDLWIFSGEERTFVVLSALNLGLVALLSLFDALFIDLYLLLVWRPALLDLPEGQPTRASMVRHIRRQFTAGWVFKVPIAVLGAALSRVLMTRLG